MSCTYSFHNERLGEIEVLEKINASGMSIRVHEQGIVRVTVRPGTTMQEVGRYVVSHAEWIEQAKERMKTRSHKVTIFTPETQFKTNEHELLMTADSRDNKVHLTVSHGQIRVSYPADVDPAENQVVQELARKGIAFALKVEGNKYLPQRLSELAKMHGFRYKSLTFKDLKSRWGSCSAQKEICLNVQLMRLPKYLIDHVLLHELCHTVEMNHGPRFHALLDKVDGGNAKLHDKELGRWSPQAY